MSKTTITTGVVRLSYCYLNEARKKEDGSEGRYETGVIIDKDDEATLDAINDAIEAAKAKGKDTKWGGKIPRGSGFKLPLHDGDVDKDDEAYAGSMFLTAKAGKKPYILDRNKNMITDPNEVYSGMYARLVLNFYPFNNESKGVAVGLEAVQKVRDGDALGGNAATFEQVVDMFGDLPDPDAAGGGFL